MQAVIRHKSCFLNITNSKILPSVTLTSRNDGSRVGLLQLLQKVTDGVQQQVFNNPVFFMIKTTSCQKIHLLTLNGSNLMPSVSAVTCGRQLRRTMLLPVLGQQWLTCSPCKLSFNKSEARNGMRKEESQHNYHKDLKPKKRGWTKKTITDGDTKLLDTGFNRSSNGECSPHTTLYTYWS